jgi:DNA-directed RNA polymerase subunit RPC12/RpoP
MYMCEDCNYIYDGDIYVKCPQCGSIDIDETKPTIIKSSDIGLGDVLAEFQKHGNTSPECFEMKWETLEKILSKYFT